MAVFVETIKLDDAVSATAIRAKDTVTNLTTAMLKQQKVEGTGKADASAKVAASKASAAATQKTIADQTKLSNTMATVRDSVTGAVSGMKSAFTSLASGDVKGAVGGLTDSVASMAKMLDLVVPGLGQAAAVVVQIAGGLVGITAGLIVSGAKFAIEASQAKAQMLSMFDALGQGVTTGVQVDDMLDGLSAKLGVTKDAMIPLVQKFEAMGITSKDALEKMTTAALSAKALAGGADSGAVAFEALSKKIQLASETGQGLKIPIKGLGSLAEMGLTVNDVAKKMGVSAKVLGEQLKSGTANASKFGDAMQNALIEKGAGPLQKMGLGAKNLGAMFQQYIGDMFEDLSSAVDPFMKEVKDLFGVFQKDAPSAKAMTAGIHGVFVAVFATATKVVPLIKHFLLDMVIYGLKAYIAIKPIAKAIADFASSAEGAQMITTVLSSLWTVLQAVGVVVAVVVVVVVALWAAMVAVSVAVWTAVGAFLGFVSSAGGALAGWVASAATAAYNFVAGLVAGIGNGAGQVVDAVKGLAGSATGAFKNALGIHSPSKVMMGLGGHVAAGAAEGIEAGTSDVHGAASGMAGAAVKGVTSGGGAPSGGGGGKGTTITFESGSIVIDGAGKSAEGLTEELVSQVFQRMALEAGL